MKNHIYVLDEFLKKIQIPIQTLEVWEKEKLISPVGFTDEHAPFYSEHCIDQVNKIQQLLNLGYSLNDIQKIVKRVGLPKIDDEKSQKEKSDQYITVGHLAEQVGVSPRTIKHWEDKGIIVPDMRSEGGFRLYSKGYIYLCKLIQDLQLFGYSLEEIKITSDYFRDFLTIQKNLESQSIKKNNQKLEDMLRAIDRLFEKITLFKGGIERWEDLLRKKKKEIINLKNKNRKRAESDKGVKHA